MTRTNMTLGTARRHLSSRTASPTTSYLGAALAAVLLATPSAAAPPEPAIEASDAPAPEVFSDAAARFDVALDAWDLAAAEAAVAELPAGSARDVKAGVLALHRAEYPEAEALLSGALTSGQLPSASAITQEAQHYLALARGEQRALGPALRQLSPDGHVEIVCADARDAILAPYLFAAMADARAALGADLGVLPDHPVRFEILDDPAKLALVSPLTLDNVYTTGTVGITKYRRIIMVSPRVLLYGYGWLDTAVHEYVHYLVTLRTRNRAPVWLQEGLAKLLETRWRSATPLPLEPAPRKLLARGLARDDLVSFAEMYPSLAMLPSQERAALAYAQVQTMLELLREEQGQPGLAVLLDRVAAGGVAEDALASAWGGSFAAFHEHWKATMRRQQAQQPRGRGAAQAALPRRQQGRRRRGRARPLAARRRVLAPRRRQGPPARAPRRALDAARPPRAGDPPVRKGPRRRAARRRRPEARAPTRRAVPAARPARARRAAAAPRRRRRPRAGQRRRLRGPRAATDGRPRRGPRRAHAGGPGQPLHPDAALRSRPARGRPRGAQPRAGALPRVIGLSQSTGCAQLGAKVRVQVRGNTPGASARRIYGLQKLSNSPIAREYGRRLVCPTHECVLAIAPVLPRRGPRC